MEEPSGILPPVFSELSPSFFPPTLPKGKSRGRWFKVSDCDLKKKRTGKHFLRSESANNFVRRVDRRHRLLIKRCNLFPLSTGTCEGYKKKGSYWGMGGCGGGFSLFPLMRNCFVISQWLKGQRVRGRGAPLTNSQTFAKVYHAEYNLATSEIH